MAPRSKSNRTFKYFFDLPPELREDILSYACCSPDGFLVGACLPPSLYYATSSAPHKCYAFKNAYGEPQMRGGLRPVRVPMSLFLASAQMYREASATFYGKNTFHFNLVGGGKHHMAPMVDEEFGLFAGGVTLPVRHRIRHAVIYMRRVGGQYANVVGPALNDMVLRGALRDLEVRIRAPVREFVMPPVSYHQHGDADDFRIVSSAPFQSLLRLLADPYLERAAVCVERLHWTLWCPFHAIPKGLEERKQNDGALLLVDSSNDVHCMETTMPMPKPWVDVDVPALVRTYAEAEGEWNILAVGE